MYKSFLFFFSSRRRHTRSYGDLSSDVCSADLVRLVGRFISRGMRALIPSRRGRFWWTPSGGVVVVPTVIVPVTVTGSDQATTTVTGADTASSTVAGTDRATAGVTSTDRSAATVTGAD